MDEWYATAEWCNICGKIQPAGHYLVHDSNDSRRMADRFLGTACKAKKPSKDCDKTWKGKYKVIRGPDTE